MVCDEETEKERWRGVNPHSRILTRAFCHTISLSLFLFPSLSRSLPLPLSVSLTCTHWWTELFLSMVSFVSFISASNKAFLCTQRREKERWGEGREWARERDHENIQHSSFDGRFNFDSVFRFGSLREVNRVVIFPCRWNTYNWRVGQKYCISIFFTLMYPHCLSEMHMVGCFGTCECVCECKTGWEVTHSWKSWKSFQSCHCNSAVWEAQPCIMTKVWCN